MRKLKSLFKKIKNPGLPFFFVLCICIIIFVPIIAASINIKKSEAHSSELTVLNIWQIDGFEGGKGSRAAYLQNLGNAFYERCGAYTTVTTLTADAARENLKAGIVPDLISYAAGMYGIENFISGKNPYYSWCNGGYCLLSTTDGADFSDVTAENTVINAGTGNLSAAAAMFCGLNGAAFDKPTGAYVKLINNKFKYMLGTQRDIFRLKTRGVAFSIKPITQFNDLYQNISVTAKETKRRSISESFILYLAEQTKEITKLGLMCGNTKLYDDEMSSMENINYEFTLKTPVSESIKKEIDFAIENKDIKKLKILFN